MARVDSSALSKKLEAYFKQDSVKQQISDKITKSNGTGSIASPAEVAESAAIAFITVISSKIREKSAAGFFSQDIATTMINSLAYSSAYETTKGTYGITVYFDMDVGRDSLYPKEYPSGLDDIVLLLDSGYSAGSPVYGKWKDDKQIRSLQQRDGANFVDETFIEFFTNYSRQYGVVDIKEILDKTTR